MNAHHAIEQIRAVLAGDARGELQSCADAVQEIGYILVQVDARKKPKIKRAPAPTTYPEACEYVDRIDAGIYYLRTALRKLERAPNTVARVKLAISSAKGAKRHAEGQVTRLEMKGQA